MNTFSRIFFLMLIHFCFTSCRACNIDSVGPEYQTMYSMISRAANELEKKYNLSFAGHGGRTDLEDKTTEIFASFQINRLLTKEEARTMILDIVDVFLNVINNDKDHRPYLQYYPFDVHGLRIAIFISNKDRSTPLDPNLCTISLYNGMIHYCTEDPENPLRYKSEIYESYEEALQKGKTKK